MRENTEPVIVLGILSKGGFCLAERESDKAAVQKVVSAKKKLLAAGCCLLVVLALVTFLWRSQTSRPTSSLPSPEMATMGVVNLQKAMKAHSAYPELEKLYAEREALRADLAMESQLGKAKAPAADPQAFAQLADQKEKMAGFQAYTKLRTQLQELERVKRQETQGDFQTAKKTIDDAYLNAIFNIRLKLDNADSMHLSADAVHALEQDLENLQRERGQKQYELEQRYEAAIRSYINEAAGTLRGEVQEKQTRTAEQLQAEQLKNQTEAQNRNLDAMEKAMDAQGQRHQRLLEKRAALQSKDREIQALEDHILKDLAGKAAKLAILHHFTLILANPAVNLQAIDVGMIHVGAWPEKYKPVVSVDAADLTEELIAEIN